MPLYGVPFAIKDNIDLAGIPTTAACPAFAYTPDESATLVAQLIALGAVPIGKTNLDQFATGLNGTRSPYGKCRNSVHPDYPSGGSSAGSSLAVALGVASFALGTDTAGSGRVPAGLNNLVGLKATKGLLSTGGRRAGLPHARLRDVLHGDRARSERTARAHRASRSPRCVQPQESAMERRERVRQARGHSASACRRNSNSRAAPKARRSSRRLAQTLEAAGGEAVEIDFAPFVEAASLLYEGPWVAERYSVAGELMRGESGRRVARDSRRAGEGAGRDCRRTVSRAVPTAGVESRLRRRARITGFRSHADLSASRHARGIGARSDRAELVARLLHQLHEPARLRGRRDADRVHEEWPAVGRDGVRPRVHGSVSVERRRSVAANQRRRSSSGAHA